jgi:hypothetical protein
MKIVSKSLLTVLLCFAGCSFLNDQEVIRFNVVWSCGHDLGSPLLLPACIINCPVQLMYYDTSGMRLYSGFISFTGIT